MSPARSTARPTRPAATGPTPGGRRGGPVEAPASVNLIVGGEEFLAERRRRSIVEAARGSVGNPDLPVEMHRCADLSSPELAELLSPSLFAEDRIIVISGLEDTGKDTLALLESAVKEPPEGVVLVLTHTGKGRNKAPLSAWPKLGAAVHEAAEIKARDRVGFVNAEFRSHGVRTDPDVALSLLDSVGSDLRELASAVSQLVADTGGDVTVASVRKYYQGRAEVSGFEIADLALSGQFRLAVTSARRALQLGVALPLIAAALSGAMSDVARVAGAGRIDPRRQAAEFGMAPWKLEKAVRTARHWSPAAIAAGVQVVAQLDADVKGQSLHPEWALEQAVRRLAELAQRG